MTDTLTTSPLAAARAPRRDLVPASPPRMGYQPSLDGLRALSVGIVLLYHAGFSWMHGGFFGVEVFFVVSGFLITSLLLEEHDRFGSVSFRGFWTRRARRLLPALFAVLVAVAVWAAFAGSAEQQSQLRRDIPWSVFYVGNWGQILGDVPYFAGEPPLLRHLWSLAVEEQWYLIWPLVFVGIIGLGISHRAKGAWIVGAGFAVFALMFWMHGNSPSPLGGPPSLFEGLNRTNFLYLSTVTRAGGLLLGAGAAFWWRPWRWSNADSAPIGRHLDPIGAAALAMIACAAAVAHVTAGYVYQWLLPLVSILSLVAIMVAVHPAAVGMRRILSWPPLVEIGKRSYGLYLWSWPIFVIFGATEGSVSRVRVGDGRHRRGDRGVVPLARDAGPQGCDRGLVERPDARRHLIRAARGRCARARLSGGVLRECRALRSLQGRRRVDVRTPRRGCSGAGRRRRPRCRPR